MKLFKARMTRIFWVRRLVHGVAFGIQHVIWEFTVREKRKRVNKREPRRERQVAWMRKERKKKKERERVSMSASIDSTDYFCFFEQTFVSSHPYNYIAIPFCQFGLSGPARFLFFISSLSLFLHRLSLLSYNVFVIKYDLKAYSLFVPPISRDYRETDAFCFFLFASLIYSD